MGVSLAVKGAEVCEGITLMPEGGCICGWERALSSCSKITDDRTAAQFMLWRANSGDRREMYATEAHRSKKHKAAIGSIAQQNICSLAHFTPLSSTKNSVCELVQ